MSEQTAVAPQAIAKREAPVHVVPFGERGAALRDSNDLMKLAYIMAFGLSKSDKPTEREIYGAALMIQTGSEVGLSPVMSTRALYVVNGRPAWMLEGLTAVMRKRGVIPANDPKAWDCQYENLPPDGTPIKDWPNNAACVVTFRRAEWREPKTARFSVGDAKLAGLWGKSGPWSNYPKRQMYARCGGFIARDFASDVTLGIPVYEEARDVAQIHEPATGARLVAPAPADAPGLLSAVTDAQPGETIDVSAEPVDAAEDAAEEIAPEPEQEPAEEPPAFDASAAEDRLANAVAATVDEHDRADVLRHVRPEPLASQADLDAALARLAEHPASSAAPTATEQPTLFDAPATQARPAHRDTGARRPR